MLARSFKTGLSLLVAGVVLGGQARYSRAQEIAPPAAPAPAAAADDLPAVPKGVEVLTRGPIHEAFASLTTEAAPTAYVAKQPPKAIDEMPPEEKPEGDVLWIGGYWAWDDDRNDFLWVSGTWRAAPPGKQWVAGYWREDGAKYQWVPGFWHTATAKEEAQQVTYQPAPPALPEVAPPGEKPNPESFFVPGHWVWKVDHYGWQPGYWAKVEPGYVWTAAHYRWTPSGYIYIPGYWDYAVSRRGMLYAPVVIDTRVVGATYVYTPAYAVHETVVVDALWVRPSHCHYYFGDYYGDEYHDRGFESCVVYSRGHYDSIIVYETYEHRREPNWLTIQINIGHDRYEHRESRPPRTLVEQIRIGNRTNVVVVAPAARVAAARGGKVVVVEKETRVQIRQQAVVVRQVSEQRVKTEVAVQGGAPKQPHVAALNVPKQEPVVTKPVAAAPIAGAHMPNVGGTPTTPATGAKPPITASTLPSAATNPPAPTHPAVTTPPITTAAAHTTPAAPTTPTTPMAPTTPGTHPAPPPPPPSGTASTTHPGTTPTAPIGPNQAHPGTTPAKPGDPPAGHKPPPPKDKDKDTKDKDKDKDKNP